MEEAYHPRPSSSDREIEMVDCGPRVLILNPVSGDGDHRKRVIDHAESYGFDVYETTHPGHAQHLAQSADTDRIDTIAVAGGDGTVHEVLTGLYAASSLSVVDLTLIPTGTMNVIATRLAVRSIEEGFDSLERNTSRAIDVGRANDEPFLGTCLIGVIADANSATSTEAKQALGQFAYVVTTLRMLRGYDGRSLVVDLGRTTAGGRERWQGNVLLVMVGNALAFPAFGRQAAASMENGRFDVTIIEELPSRQLLDPRQIIGDPDIPITRRTDRNIEIRHDRGESVSYTVDGEPRTADRLDISILPRALSVHVGAQYVPRP